ncbi:hypothetical protein BL240_01435 [Pseudomonas putida]|uniref:Uncharacterized protein n=1 Tax=Pseudomonas putida TaxID=303 RepID=A0A1L5PJ26_PSEPU|nr:hypothetical protein BL240_01435 [Pseudomonas putida]
MKAAQPLSSLLIYRQEGEVRPSRWQASPQAANAIDRFVLDYPRAGAVLQGSWLASGWDEYAASLYRPLRG